MGNDFGKQVKGKGCITWTIKRFDENIKAKPQLNDNRFGLTFVCCEDSNPQHDVLGMGACLYMVCREDFQYHGIEEMVVSILDDQGDIRMTNEKPVPVVLVEAPEGFSEEGMHFFFYKPRLDT